MEEKRGKVRTDGDSRAATARKQRGERGTDTAEDRQRGARRQLRGPGGGDGLLRGSSFSAPGQGRAAWLQPTWLEGPGWESLARKGGASKGEGARADLGVDALVQGQVVSLLQVQEEEPV